MLLRNALVIAAVLLGATSAQADFAKVNSANEFKRIVSGKTLTRPLIRIEVSPDGAIKGKGAKWEVSGSWTWRDGYFCRDLYWDGDDLGYNCQEVAVRKDRIRFTSDRGTGPYADFRLR